MIYPSSWAYRGIGGLCCYCQDWCLAHFWTNSSVRAEPGFQKLPLRWDPAGCCWGPAAPSMAEQERAAAWWSYWTGRVLWGPHPNPEEQTRGSGSSRSSRKKRLNLIYTFYSKACSNSLPLDNNMLLQMYKGRGWGTTLEGD